MLSLTFPDVPSPSVAFFAFVCFGTGCGRVWEMSGAGLVEVWGESGAVFNAFGEILEGIGPQIIS